MDTPTAKEILRRYRPGTSDESDPEVQEALAQTKSDPELAKWLDHQVQLQAMIRCAFAEIKTPEGLKESILAGERHRARTAKRSSVVSWVALAATFALLATVLIFNTPPRAQDTFAGFRNRMVGNALRRYGMDMLSTNVSQIRGFLKTKGLHDDFVLPPGLAALPGIGCAVESWQSLPTAMVCLRATNQDTLYLFVIDRSQVQGAPKNESPEFKQVSALATASWTRGELAYLLATRDDSMLRKAF